MHHERILIHINSPLPLKFLQKSATSFKHHAVTRYLVVSVNKSIPEFEELFISIRYISESFNFLYNLYLLLYLYDPFVIQLLF